MNVLLLVALVILVILLTKRESFTELFGFSGHTKHVSGVKFDDPRPDLSGYNPIEVKVDHDIVEEFVMLANTEISKRIGLSTYIIETTSIKGYVNDDGEMIYECMFMTVKNSGFSFGFSVVASYKLTDAGISLISLRSQPLGVESPENIQPFTDGSDGREFVDYKLVKEAAIPAKSEFDSVKNNLV